MKTPTGGVISERNELHGKRWADCAYAAGMMMFRDCGGHFGLSLDKEREALERSDSRPDEIGARMTDLVEAMMKRYKWAGHHGSDLARDLQPGRTLVVMGTAGTLPTRLRRWQRTFAGGHAVAVRVEHDGMVYLDPLAPMGYAGDPVNVAELRRFAWAWRWGHWGEVAKPVMHVVRSGETLSGIAEAHGLTLAKLLAFSANMKYRHNPGLIHPGDKVRVK